MIASIVPIVRKTWDDRGDHMETLSSAIPAIGTIEAIVIARIAQVQTIRTMGAIKDFLMETIPDDLSDRGDPNITRSCRERHDSCQNVLKVAADNEFSLELFTAEVQIYDCLCNKFSKESGENTKGLIAGRRSAASSVCLRRKRKN